MADRIHRLALLLLWSFILPATLMIALPTRAQSSASAVLSPPQTRAFPQIITYLDVHDAQGAFIHGIKAEELRVLEDGRPLPITGLSELRPGVQFVTAITPGPPFGIRDIQGISRYDLLVQALSQWAESLPSTNLDDISLVATNGPEAIHLNNPKDWENALKTYQPDLRTATPSLEVLARAMDIAANTTPREGMERAVLFVTPPPASDMAVGLQSLIARANQLEIRIFVWSISSVDLFTSPSVSQLQNLAAKTGGKLFAFSGIEAIPSLEDFLEPLRSIYRLAYNSHIKTSGLHQLLVEINTLGLQLATDSQSFNLSIQPPNPMFVSLPSQITRANPDSSQDIKNNQTPDSLLVPSEQELEILIEFPDGFTRPISQTVLYVDGAAIGINSTPPFEKFTWDLSQYTVNGNHSIRVEAMDKLGLIGSSIEIPIEVTVKRSSGGLLLTLSRQSLLLAGLTVVLAGAILVLVLVLGGHVQPRVFGQGNQSILQRKSSITTEALRMTRKHDPLTQVIEIKTETESRHRTHWINRLQWPQRRRLPKADAFLTPISEDEAAKSTIPIAADEITFGRDPSQVTWVLDDPSVEALHARMHREGDTFRLADQGSIAGTWVNYTPVSSDGTLLEHGDLVHIGRIGFRFTQREPTHIRKPLIIPLEPPS